MGTVTLRLEAIGDDTEKALRTVEHTFASAGHKSRSRPLRPVWVAEITGPDAKYGLARQFLKGDKDYSRANSVGSRGVYIYYQLDRGKYYEVSSPESWSRVDRYFARVDDNGKIVKVDRSEVDHWIASS